MKKIDLIKIKIRDESFRKTIKDLIITIILIIFCLLIANINVEYTIG